jgi:hypothetical protein
MFSYGSGNTFRNGLKSDGKGQKKTRTWSCHDQWDFSRWSWWLCVRIVFRYQCDKMTSIFTFRCQSKKSRSKWDHLKNFIMTQLCLHRRTWRHTGSNKICRSNDFLKPSWPESKSWLPLIQTQSFL